MLVEAEKQGSTEKNGELFKKILPVLAILSRETDVRGWYKRNSVIGVIFTELPVSGQSSVLSALQAKILCALQNHLTSEQFNQIEISFHLFPDERGDEGKKWPTGSALHPDTLRRTNTRSGHTLLKRIMDIVGSTFALLLGAPLFLVIAAAIKATSKGPILFRQRRIGQHGKPFFLLKFRTMYENNNAAVHEAYIKELIAGKAPQNLSNGHGKRVYKLTSDPRITRVGAFLRRTSLDEVPQFLNVLKGEMSLVGPRPPISYEVDNYELWHRRRFLEVKPGITGLWQVSGRNRINFDDMVRLDLLYAQSWTVWKDLEILLRTPFAVFEGAD